MALYFTKVSDGGRGPEGLLGHHEPDVSCSCCSSGKALSVTGLAKIIGLKNLLGVKTEGQDAGAFCAVCVVLSTFLSNIGTMVVMAPILMGVCRPRAIIPPA
jgi:hypothetical protein